MGDGCLIPSERRHAISNMHRESGSAFHFARPSEVDVLSQRGDLRTHTRLSECAGEAEVPTIPPTEKSVH